MYISTHYNMYVAVCFSENIIHRKDVAISQYNPWYLYSKRSAIAIINSNFSLYYMLVDNNAEITINARCKYTENGLVPYEYNIYSYSKKYNYRTSYNLESNGDNKNYTLNIYDIDDDYNIVQSNHDDVRMLKFILKRGHYYLEECACIVSTVT